MMEISRVNIDISSCVSVCRCLENIIRMSIGPNAQQTMISAATGNVLISSDGLTILRSLHMAHPVGRMVIQSVSSHHSHSGNNSKAFVVILTEALKQIEHFLEKLSMHSLCGQSRVELTRLSHAIGWIQSETLPNEVVPQLLKISTLTNLSDNNYQNVKRMCLAIITTSMTGKFSRQIVEILSNLLSDFVFMNSRSVGNLYLEIRWLINNFDQLSIQMVGLPGESQVTEGILIQRDFAVKADDFDQLCDTHCKYILVDCELNEPDRNSTYSFAKEESLQDTLEHQSKSVQAFLIQCRENQVKVLITTQKLSDMILYFCKKFGISAVHMVPEEMVSLIATLSATEVIQTLQDSLTDACIGRAKFCRTLNHSSCRYVRLGVDACVQITVCAPVQSIARHYHSALLNSLKCVKMWLETQYLLRKGISTTQQKSATEETSPVGISVIGGGLTEYVIYRTLQEIKESKSDNYLRVACDIIGKAVLRVVGTLSENSSSSKNRQSGFIQLLQEMKSKTERGDVVWGIGENGRLQDMQKLCVYESLVSKYILLNDVISILQQILRSDMIVSVTDLKSNMSDSD